MTTVNASETKINANADAYANMNVNQSLKKRQHNIARALTYRCQ